MMKWLVIGVVLMVIGFAGTAQSEGMPLNPNGDSCSSTCEDAEAEKKKQAEEEKQNEEADWEEPLTPEEENEGE